VRNYHSIFVFVLFTELIFYPIVFIADYGLTLNTGSSFWLRFFYIFYFLWATLYILQKAKLKITNLSLLLILFFAVGVIRGLGFGNLNGAFLSHCFYLLMPVVMISYGVSFFYAYEASAKLRQQLKTTMKWAFLFGILAVVMFTSLVKGGYARYDAIDIWNTLLGGPFFFSRGTGLGPLSLTGFFTVVAGKRGLIISFLAAFLLYLYLKGRSAPMIIVLAVLVLVIVLQSSLEELSGIVRMQRSIASLEGGDLGSASAGRWLESAAAIEQLNKSVLNWIFGAGFGARFFPYKDVPGAEDYVTHYTHFSFISYIWIGGLLLSISVYTYLLHLLASIIMGMKKRIIPLGYSFLGYWLIIFIVTSLFGAILMNNAFIWFVVGMCEGMRSSYSSARKRYSG